MRHEIIKLENYLLVVDDSQIKDVKPLIGKWHLEKGYILNKFPTYLTDLIDCKLVIAHLPLNNSSILEGVDLLTPLEIDEDFNPIGEYTKEYLSSLMFDGKSFVSDILLATRIGYNKAKDKFHISKEKILNLYIEECGYGMDMWSKEENDTMAKIAKIIQSISQPKLPIAFECAYQSPEDRYYEDGVGYTHNVKRITNLQGQPVWVGKYIYA